MPSALLLPLLMRLGGPIAFLLAAIIAGVMNRSFVIVPLLALASVGIGIAMKVIRPAPALDLQAMLNPQAPQTTASPFKGALPRFGVSLIIFGLMFGLAALIAALFQETDFAQRLGQTDFIIVGATMMAAISLSFLSARAGDNQMADLMAQMQTMASQMQANQPGQAANDDEAFTVDGEVIEPDDTKS